MKKIVFLILLFLLCGSLSANSIVSVDVTWETMITNYDVDESGAINIGDKIKFTIELSDFPLITDVATVSIGVLYENIQVYNDGTHGDAGYDKVFTGYWTVPEGTSTHEAPVIGNYWDDGVKKSMISDTTLSFDAQRPVINNISVSPNSFNPYIEFTEIAYSMSETVDNVTAEIYADLGRITLVKSMPKPPGDAGDNFISWWDGKEDDGTWFQDPPDRDYYIYISCRDVSGNYSDGPMATVKISSVKFKIVSLSITPTPVTPDGDEVDDRIHISTKFVMYSWDGFKERNISLAQMANLGFTAGSNWGGSTDGSILIDWPYAQTGFSIYDAGGTLKHQVNHNIDDDLDGDIVFINIFPVRFPCPPYVSDGDTGNDWETLVPLYDDGLGGHEFSYGNNKAADGIFTAEHIFIIELLGDWEDGCYIVRAGAELTGIKHHEIPMDPYIGVHFEPEWKGGFISTEMAQATFEVDNTGVSGVDNVDPHVEAVYPEANSEIVYRLSLVSAYIKDNTDGSGIDFLSSDIFLSGESGNKLAGRKINNAMDVISWELDTPLNKKGKYFINVLPVDKRGNQPGDYLQYPFQLNVTDDNVNMITVNNGGTVIDSLGRVCLSAPPYSVEQDIRITVFNPLAFPGNLAVYGGYQFMPSSVSFKRPVTLTVYYSQADKADLPSGITETSLRIYNWIKDRWIYQGGNVDVNNMAVTVSGIRKIDGFYALLPETVGGLPTEVVSDVQVDKPFRENGYISFKVSGSISSMKLLIYNLHGALIKDVPINVNAINNAGYYDISWDVLTGDGALSNNGVYIFRFIVKREDGERKIVSKAIPIIK